MTDPTLSETASSSSAPIKDPAQRRLILIGAIFMCLLFGLMMVHSQVESRQGQARYAADSIAASWAPDQLLIGPVLLVPGERTREVVDHHGNRRTVVDQVELSMLPDHLQASINLTYEERRRGIFATPIFTAHVGLEASFDPARLSSLPRIEGVVWQPDGAWVEMEATDSRGFLPGESWKWNDQPLAVAAGRLARSGNGRSLRGSGVDMKEGGVLRADFRLAFTQGIRVAPVGAKTEMAMHSAWPDPSFTGARLPTRREVSEAGFKAAWETGSWLRGLPESWHTLWDARAIPDFKAYEGGAVGVIVKPAVDPYRLNLRATGYGVLFLLVGLGGLLAADLRTGSAVSLVAYLCAGAALVLFFLTLLATSEHLPFALAYLIATLLEVAILGWYLAAIGMVRWIVSTLVGAITLAHGYLYFVLRLEDHALLAGSVVLWAILLVVMALSRNLRNATATP